LAAGDCGNYTWIPDPNQVGINKVTLKAENESGFYTQTWDISVDPNIVSTAPISAKTGQKYSYSPEVIGKGIIEWSLSGQPDGMTIDNANDESVVIVWTPFKEQIGDYTIALKVVVNGREDSLIRANPIIADIFSDTL
jgi:hypothetical protein